MEPGYKHLVAVDLGTNISVSTLAISDAGDLYAGGAFTAAGGFVSAHIARYTLPTPPFYQRFLPVILRH